MMRRKCLAALLAVFALLMTSCSTWDSLMASIGFDTRSYSQESVIKSRLGDSELEATLSDALRMLTMKEPCLAEFESSSEAIKKCRDSVLNYMLDVNFSRYTGDIELLDEAAKEYPQIKITTLIPAPEFSQMYYRYFGGATKITDASGEYFSYLDRLNAYTSLSHPISPEFTVSFSRLDETENTYRATVRVTVDGIESPEYNVTVIKREDKTFYFRSVTRTDVS